MDKGNIIIDGIIFQFQQNKMGGISRVWYEYLRQLSEMPIAERIIILDREKTAPRFPRFTYHEAMGFSFQFMDFDPVYLEGVISGLNGSLFVSTYFSFAEKTPTVLMVHDMTPEMLGLDFDNPEWIMKQQAIERSDAFITISNNTQKDFLKLNPHLSGKPVEVIWNSVSGSFQRHSPREIELFKRSYGITKPYYIFVGSRYSYKNLNQLLKAYALMEDKDDYEIMLVGGGDFLEDQYQPFARRKDIKILHLDDKQLSLAYSAALALVYPSKYEGFGLPLLEAMQSGCPVITADNSSLPEVAGDAALYVDCNDIGGLKDALVKVRDEKLRESMIKKGLERLRLFSWEESGEKMNSYLLRLLEELPGRITKTDLPLNSGNRFFYTLSLSSDTAELASALFQTVKLLNSLRESFDFTAIEGYEKAIVESFPDEWFNRLEGLVRDEYHDHYLNYWYALLLERRQRPGEALDQIMLVLHKGGLNARVLVKALVLAQRLQRPVTAFSLLQNILKLKPDDPVYQREWDELRELQYQLRDNVAVQGLSSSGLPAGLDEWNFSGELISIILPTKGRNAGFMEFLKSLPAALAGINYEILLYHGGEREALLNGLEEEYHFTAVISDEELFEPNESFSWAKVMDDGFRRAQGDYIMFASDDIILHKNAFPYALKTLKENDNAGGVTFLYRNLVEDYGTIFSTFGYDSTGGKTYINFGLIKKEAYEQTEGFDERYGFYWGDADISMQLHREGFDIAVSLLSLVDHVNVVDAAREKNSGDRYFNDTKYFLGKWERHPLFKNIRCLDKIRFAVAEEDEQKLEEAAAKGTADTGSNTEEQSVSFSAVQNEVLVSAVVSLYKAGKYIRGLLDDLVAQTIYPEGRLEIIVVDSASPENEGNIVKEYMREHSHIKYVRTKERITIYEAWNRGIELAGGKYITNANADDRHRPDAYEIMLREFEEHPDTDILYADVLQTSEPNDMFDSPTKKEILSWVDFDPDLLLIGCFLGPQPMWKKELHKKHGLFDGNLEVVGDFEFWLRVSRSAVFRHLREPLGLYLNAGDSLEHRNQKRTQMENILVQKKYFERYIHTAGDVKRVEKLLDTVYRSRKDEEYDKYARQLLQRRMLALELRSNMNILLDEKTLGLGEKYIQTADKLLSILKSGELFLTEHPYIAVLLFMKAFYFRNAGDKEKANSLSAEATQLTDSQEPETYEDIVRLYRSICPH